MAQKKPGADVAAFGAVHLLLNGQRGAAEARRENERKQSGPSSARNEQSELL